MDKLDLIHELPGVQSVEFTQTAYLINFYPAPHCYSEIASLPRGNDFISRYNELLEFRLKLVAQRRTYKEEMNGIG